MHAWNEAYQLKQVADVVASMDSAVVVMWLNPTATNANANGRHGAYLLVTLVLRYSIRMEKLCKQT